MIVDLIRTCKTSQMRFYLSDGRTATVRWYFAPDGAIPLPFATPFNNQDWDEWHGAGSTLGEDESAARGARYDGHDPGNASGTGPPCGSADQWLHGQSLPPATPTPIDSVYSLPTCCPRRPSPTLIRACTVFSPAWDAYCISVQGLSPAGNCSALNGDWSLAYVGSCQWNTWGAVSPYPPSGVGWLLDGTAPPALYLSPRTSTGTTPFIYSVIPPKGDISLAQRLLVNSPGNTCSGLPSAIILHPLGECDVILIGSIIMDAGVDAVPNLYLLCDGRAVSRSQYSLLFGRVGTTYGAGDGSTTFNLPNLVGRILYGSGGAYSTGQAVGNDSPLLNANQLPAHTHPITDPSHVHTTNGRAGLSLYVAFNSGSHINATTGTANIDAETMDSATTGITVNANVTAGNALDVRQAGVAVRPLIYAGQ